MVIISKRLDSAAHALVAGVVVVLQSVTIMADDKPLDHFPMYLTALAACMMLFQLMLHMIMVIRPGSAGKEKDMGDKLRHQLTQVALLSQSAAFALETEVETLPLVSLILIGAMRLLDSFMDFDRPLDALKEEKDVSMIRLMVIHMLLALSFGINLFARIAWDNDNNSMDSEAVNKRPGVALSDELKTADTFLIVFVGAHLVLIPASMLIDRLFQMLSIPYDFIALNRLPVVRHVVAGCALFLGAYVAGGAYGEEDILPVVVATILYAGADVLGRNVA